MAAFATALAAGLVEGAARRARDDWPEAEDVARRARHARERAAPLATANANAYREAVEAMTGGPTGDAPTHERDQALDN